jgi:hypothetical protein
VRQLPLGGWDEWYVFPDQRRLPKLHVFVNYGNFTPNPHPDLSTLNPTWDRVAAREAQRHSMEQTERFWKQIGEAKPTAFLAEGDALSCVIGSETLFARVLALTALGAA